MSKTQAATDIIKIGNDTCYQVYVRTLRNGLPRYSFKVGSYWINPTNNMPTLVPYCDLYNYDEQTKARVAAKKHLEKLTEQAALTPPEVQVQVVPHQPVQPNALPQPDAQHYPPNYQQTQAPPVQQVQWQPQVPQQPRQAKSLQPPKPYPSGGYE